MTDMFSSDVVVIGSGAAGLTAAFFLARSGQAVTVLEAENVLGGTSAIGGGNLWIPANPLMTQGGDCDLPADAFAYLRTVSGPGPAENTARTFLDNAPELVAALERETQLRFASIDRPDYHSNWNGAAYGRSLEPLPFETAQLGEAADWFRINPGRPPVTYVEGRSGIAPEVVSERQARGVRTQGAALVAGLGQACIERGVRFIRNAACHSIERDLDSFTVHYAGGQTVVANAIVIASGGYGRNPRMREFYLPAVELLPLSAGRGEGDGLILGLDLGASPGRTGWAWMGPAHLAGPQAAPRMVVRELALPGSMLVNESGRRFVNESLGYNDVGSAMLTFDPAHAIYPNARSWLIFDEAFRSRYSVLGYPPGSDAPDHWQRATSLAELAATTGLPYPALAETVSKLNEYAVAGVDPEFGRGGDAHQRFNGDEDHYPNPCLGETAVPPYYAVPMRPGICSTKGGLAVTEQGQLIDRRGNPLPGLFACGDVADSVMGFGYAGAGASIGPAMTFAMMAAKAIAGVSSVVP